MKKILNVIFIVYNNCFTVVVSCSELPCYTIKAEEKLIQILLCVSCRIIYGDNSFFFLFLNTLQQLNYRSCMSIPILFNFFESGNKIIIFGEN